MLNRFFYFIFGFVLLGLCGCSALTGYTYEEYSKKTENIRLVFETPKNEIYLLGNHADYVFKDKGLFLFLDIISAKGFYTDDRIIMTVNSSSNVKLEAKFKLRHPVAQGMEEALFFFLTPVIVPIGMVIWGWNKITN